MPAEPLFTIAVLPHPLDPTALAESPVRYWALGGEPNAATPLSLADPPRLAHASGSPQGRSPAEIGPHGATLVDVDEAGVCRLTPLATDVVRWHHERVAISAATLRNELDHQLHERLDAIVAASPERILLIRWTISGEGPLLAAARGTGLAAELLAGLRVDHGYRTHAAWSTAVEIEPPALPEAWYEQATLLGDFLRAVRVHEHNPAEPLGLQGYLSERQATGPLAACAAPEGPARGAILRQVAHLGVDLLYPDDAGVKEASP